MTLAQNKDMNPLDAWNNSQVYLLNSLGKAFGEVYTVQAFYNFLKNVENDINKTNKDTKEALAKMYQLYCLTRIEQDLGTFRDGDYLSSDQGDLVRKHII